MDVLSDVLAVLRLQGEELCWTEPTARWGLSFTAQNAQFHMIEQGSCLLQTNDARRTVQLAAGDLVILPHGRGHRLFDSRDTPVIPITSLIQPGQASVLRFGDGGTRTTVLCGRFRFHAPLGGSALSGFPALIHVRGSEGRPVEWLDMTMRFLASEARSNAPGKSLTMTRLMDLLFVEAIRYWLITSDEWPRGSIAALRDPRIAAAMVRMHEQPGRNWDVVTLAAQAGMSRSSFGQRFVELVGEPPSRYLTRWRMQVATRLLHTPGTKVGQIAEQVGYESEAAFSRVFKRYTRMSPAAFRDRGARESAPVTDDRRTA